jgi:hypothetical protein
MRAHTHPTEHGRERAHARLALKRAFVHVNCLALCLVQSRHVSPSRPPHTRVRAHPICAGRSSSASAVPRPSSVACCASNARNSAPRSSCRDNVSVQTAQYRHTHPDALELGERSHGTREQHRVHRAPRAPIRPAIVHMTTTHNDAQRHESTHANWVEISSASCAVARAKDAGGDVSECLCALRIRHTSYTTACVRTRSMTCVPIAPHAKEW